MNLTQIITSTIAWTSVTGKPKWASAIDIIPPIVTQQLGTVYSDIATTATVATEPITGASYAGTASAASVEVGSIRRTIHFSKISGLAAAFFEAYIGTSGTLNDVCHMVLQNVTDAVAITNSDISVTSTASALPTEVVSGDISANLPVADKVMGIRMYNATGARKIWAVGARLLLYW